MKQTYNMAGRQFSRFNKRILHRERERTGGKKRIIYQFWPMFVPCRRPKIEVQGSH